MKEIEQILRGQFGKYPSMEAQDALKLLYQHCFGCEHMLANKEKALSMLKEEMDHVVEMPGGELWEDIGNGYIRLNLAAAKARKISPEKIEEVFVQTAKIGRKTDFAEAVTVLERMTKDGDTPFSEQELKDCVNLNQDGVFRHSEHYRTLYKPSYRVLDWKLAETSLDLS